MYRRIDDFLAAYKNLNHSTDKTLAILTDTNLDHPVAPGHRTIGQIAWHIVTTVPEMMNRTGLGLGWVEHEAPPPRTATEIREAYARVAVELTEAIRSGWTDATLDETDDMYGQTWSRGLSLTSLVHHEIHHRGEVIVLLRQAGAVVPGVFGPAREEWTAYGMEPPAW